MSFKETHEASPVAICFPMLAISNKGSYTSRHRRQIQRNTSALVERDISAAPTAVVNVKQATMDEFFRRCKYRGIWSLRLWRMPHKERTAIHRPKTYIATRSSCPHLFARSPLPLRFLCLNAKRLLRLTSSMQSLDTWKRRLKLRTSMLRTDIQSCPTRAVGDTPG